MGDEAVVSELRGFGRRRTVESAGGPVTNGQVQFTTGTEAVRLVIGVAKG